jgi:chromosome segregation ATPase
MFCQASSAELICVLISSGQLRQYESDLVQARSQCADLQKERQQLEADMQQLRELNTSHAAKVQSQATRIETLEQEQCKSQKEQAELHAQLRSGQAELAQLQQTTRALEEQLQRDHAAAADKVS